MALYDFLLNINEKYKNKCYLQYGNSSLIKGFQYKFKIKNKRLYLENGLKSKTYCINYINDILHYMGFCQANKNGINFISNLDFLIKKNIVLQYNVNKYYVERVLELNKTVGVTKLIVMKDITDKNMSKLILLGGKLLYQDEVFYVIIKDNIVYWCCDFPLHIVYFWVDLIKEKGICIINYD